MTRLVFLDTETTALSDEYGEVWEIAAIARDADGDSEWLWQIAPRAMYHADPTSLRIGRFYVRFDPRAKKQGALIMAAPGKTSDQPEETTPGDVAATLTRIVYGAHIVGAVPDFDCRHLRRFLREYGQAWASHYIDVETLAVGWLYGKAAGLALERPDVDWLRHLRDTVSPPWQSDTLYRALDVDAAAYAAHTALGDARLARAVYDAVTGGAR